MMHRELNYVTSDTASKIVLDVLSALLNQNRDHRWSELAPRGLLIRELRNVQLVLKDTSRCATWLSKRELNYPFMVAEWLWIQSGHEDTAMISHYCKEISKYSDTGQYFFGAYGPRWKHAVSALLPLMRRDEDTRQAVVDIWRPEVYDIAFNTKDVPCTLSMQYFIRKNMVESTVVMRSSDAWLGLPYDLFNFAMLQRAVAGALGRPPGPLTVFIGSCHLYDRDRPRAREVVRAMLNSKPSDPTGVFVPPPPVFGESLGMERHESALRYGGDTCLDIVMQSAHWPLLSMLSYRNHKDKQLVHSKLRGLLT